MCLRYRARVEDVCDFFSTCSLAAGASSDVRKSSRDCRKTTKAYARTKFMKFSGVRRRCEKAAMLNKVRGCNTAASTKTGKEATDKKSRCQVETQVLCTAFRGSTCTTETLTQLVKKARNQRYMEMRVKCLTSADKVACHAAAKKFRKNAGGEEATDGTASATTETDSIRKGVQEESGGTFRSCMDDAEVNDRDVKTRLATCTTQVKEQAAKTWTDVGASTGGAAEDPDIIVNDAMAGNIFAEYKGCTSEEDITEYPSFQDLEKKCVADVAQVVESKWGIDLKRTRSLLANAVKNELNDLMTSCTSTREECNQNIQATMEDAGVGLDTGALLEMQAAGANKNIGGKYRTCVTGADVKAGTKTRADCELDARKEGAKTGLNIDGETALHRATVSDITSKMEACVTEGASAAERVKCRAGVATIITAAGYDAAKDTDRLFKEAARNVFAKSFRQCKRTSASSDCVKASKESSVIFRKGNSGDVSKVTETEDAKQLVGGIKEAAGNIMCSCPDGAKICAETLRTFLGGYGAECKARADSYMMEGAETCVYKKMKACLRKAGTTGRRSRAEVLTCGKEAKAADTTGFFGSASAAIDAWRKEGSAVVSEKHDQCKESAAGDVTKLTTCDTTLDTDFTESGIVQPDAITTVETAKFETAADSLATCWSGCDQLNDDEAGQKTCAEKCETQMTDTDGTAKGTDEAAVAKRKKRVLQVGKQGALKKGTKAYTVCMRQSTDLKKRTRRKVCKSKARAAAKKGLGHGSATSLLGDIPAMIQTGRDTNAFSEYISCRAEIATSATAAEKRIARVECYKTVNTNSKDPGATTGSAEDEDEDADASESLMRVINGAREAAKTGLAECIHAKKKTAALCLDAAMSIVDTTRETSAPENKDVIVRQSVGGSHDLCINAVTDKDATKLLACDKTAKADLINLGVDEAKVKQVMMKAAQDTTKNRKVACMTQAETKEEMTTCKIQAAEKLTALGAPEYDTQSAAADMVTEEAAVAMDTCLESVKTTADDAGDANVEAATTRVAQRKTCEKKAKQTLTDTLGVSVADADSALLTGAANKAATRCKSCVENVIATRKKQPTTDEYKECKDLGDKVLTDSGVTNKEKKDLWREEGSTKMYSLCNVGCQRTNKEKATGVVDLDCDTQCLTDFAHASGVPKNVDVTNKVTTIKAKAEAGLASDVILGCLTDGVKGTIACDKDGESAVAEFKGLLQSTGRRRLRRLDGLRALAGTSQMPSVMYVKAKESSMKSGAKAIAKTSSSRAMREGRVARFLAKFKQVLPEVKESVCSLKGKMLECLEKSGAEGGCGVDSYAVRTICDEEYCCPLPTGTSKTSIDNTLTTATGQVVKARVADLMPTGETTLTSRALAVNKNTASLADTEKVVVEGVFEVKDGTVNVGNDLGLDKDSKPVQSGASVKCETALLTSSGARTVSRLTGSGTFDVETIGFAKNVELYVTTKTSSMPVGKPGARLAVHAPVEIESGGATATESKKKCFAAVTDAAGNTDNKATTVVGKGGSVTFTSPAGRKKRKAWRTACKNEGPKALGEAMKLNPDWSTMGRRDKKHACKDVCATRDKVIQSIDTEAATGSKKPSNKRYKRCTRICMRNCMKSRWEEDAASVFNVKDTVTVEAGGKVDVGDKVRTSFKDAEVVLKPGSKFSVDSGEPNADQSWDAVEQCKKAGTATREICNALSPPAVEFSKITSDADAEMNLEASCTTRNKCGPIIGTTDTPCFASKDKSCAGSTTQLPGKIRVTLTEEASKAYLCEPESAKTTGCSDVPPMIAVTTTTPKARRQLMQARGHVLSGGRRLGLTTNTMALSVFVNGKDQSSGYDLVLTSNGYVLARKGTTVGADGTINKNAAGDGGTDGGVGTGATGAEASNLGLILGCVGGVVALVLLIAIAHRVSKRVGNHPDPSKSNRLDSTAPQGETFADTNPMARTSGGKQSAPAYEATGEAAGAGVEMNQVVASTRSKRHASCDVSESSDIELSE